MDKYQSNILIDFVTPIHSQKITCYTSAKTNKYLLKSCKQYIHWIHDKHVLIYAVYAFFKSFNQVIQRTKNWLNQGDKTYADI